MNKDEFNKENKAFEKKKEWEKVNLETDRIYFLQCGVLGWGKNQKEAVEKAIYFLQKSLQEENVDCNEIGILRAFANVTPAKNVNVDETCPN